MKKGHVYKFILPFVFIILFISCKNKNNDLSAEIDRWNPWTYSPYVFYDKIITVKNVDNDLSTEIGDDNEFNQENICEVHNQKMYKENRFIITYGLIRFSEYNEYEERRKKYFPNSIREKLGGCVIEGDGWGSLPYSYYVCNECIIADFPIPEPHFWIRLAAKISREEGQYPVVWQYRNGVYNLQYR